MGRLRRRRSGIGGRGELPVTILLCTWDNADLIADFLHHYRAMGVTRVLACDLGSTDGTTEILGGAQWRDLVEPFPFVDLRMDAHNLMLDTLRARGVGGWALAVDADEFLVTPSGQVRDPLILAAMSGADALQIPRFNLTAARSMARTATDPGTRRADAPLRIIQTHVRTPDEMLTGALASPWIYGRHGAKVLVKVGSAARIGFGNHLVAEGVQQALTGDDVRIHHFPFGSFEEFDRKIHHAADTISANPDLAAEWGWHWRRWVAMRARAGLWQEYLDQFIPDDDVTDQINAGRLVVERPLSSAAAAHGSRSNPAEPSWPAP